MNGIWVSLIRRRASSGANHSTRSISGTVIHAPERGGHSNGNVLLRAVAGSRSPSSAHGLDELATLLADLAELDRVAVGRRVAGLLLELAPRDRPRRLAVVELALRHGPHALVALRPERAAGMGEQHLDVAVGSASVQQESAAAPARTIPALGACTGCRSGLAGGGR